MLSDHRVPVETHQLGRLDSVRHRVVNGRSYLHLEAADKPVCTLVLHARTDEALRELKVRRIHQGAAAKFAVEKNVRSFSVFFSTTNPETCCVGMTESFIIVDDFFLNL